MENSFPKFSLYEILTISVVRFVPVLFLMCLYFARPQDGGTALLAASQYGHRQVVDTLLKHGANIHDQLYVSAFHSLGAFFLPSSRRPLQSKFGCQKCQFQNYFNEQ